MNAITTAESAVGSLVVDLAKASFKLVGKFPKEKAIPAPLIC